MNWILKKYTGLRYVEEDNGFFVFTIHPLSKKFVQLKFKIICPIKLSLETFKIDLTCKVSKYEFYSGNVKYK